MARAVRDQKCYEIRTREISPWLEGSRERSFELAPVLAVPGTALPAGHSSMSRGPGLGSTEVTGKGLCMVSFDWSVGCVKDGSRGENWSQILKSPGCRRGKLGLDSLGRGASLKKCEHFGIIMRTVISVELSGGSAM